MKNIYVIVLVTLFGGVISCFAKNHRETILFNNDWRFKIGNVKSAENAHSSGLGWRILTLPHDWAVEGEFSKDNPSGTGGGALPGGIGWYKKEFFIPKSDSGKNIYIDFDGVYMNSEVYINGKLLGKRPYGYIAFRYDMTPYIKFGANNNILVKVDNLEQPNSRWYSGCGIYRNVWLVKSHKIHIDHWGVFVSSTIDKNGNANVQVQTSLENGEKGAKKIIVLSSILDKDGNEVAKVETARCRVIGKDTVTQSCIIKNPNLWSTDNPYMYTLKSSILLGGEKIDEVITPLGVRSFHFDAQKGFFLNGKGMKINGVCLHHDLGCLGAAVNKVAIERQLKLLKDMGCNAVRMSHNPPSIEILDLCDEMGLLVMDEAFDMWRRKKTKHDYARYFDEWHERDITDLIRRDRNHPSIIMWSVGNEVLEQWNEASADTLTLEQANLILNFGHKKNEITESGKTNISAMLCSHLVQIVKGLDNTRPITAGCNEPSPSNNLFKSGSLDLIGYNYHNQDIASVPKNFPNKPFIITESISALMTRGYYKMPSDSIMLWPERWDKPFFDPSFSCSSYDNCHAPWGSTHEETLAVVDNNPFVSGQFIWTGFDYIGEPTPYGWPARSSYFGVIDLAGFPKDVYYLYKSVWGKEDVLHLFPHWNWKEGEEIDMWAYYNNADEVELFINGKSQGIRKKESGKYHVMWRVKYEPGVVKAVARKDGKEVRIQEIKSAGEPYAIRLTADKKTLAADGRDLSFVTVEIVDKDGNLCPNAENQVAFDVKGAAFIAGVDNGSPISLEPFKANQRKAFYGKCLVVLQNNGADGDIQLKASSDGLQEETIRISSSKKPL